MKKISLFLLSLFLCSVSVPILAQDVELVPAMVVQCVVMRGASVLSRIYKILQNAFSVQQNLRP